MNLEELRQTLTRTCRIAMDIDTEPRENNVEQGIAIGERRLWDVRDGIEMVPGTVHLVDCECSDPTPSLPKVELERLTFWQCKEFPT